MNNQNKIIVITHDNDKLIETLAILSSKDENIVIANQFTTDINLKDIPSKEWKYFMSNNDLFLSFKNNALLSISTDDNEISSGVTKEEAYAANIIPMSYSMLTMASPRILNGMTLCWIDSTKKRSKNMSKDTMEIMKTYKKMPLLYFTDDDNSEYIANMLYKYLNSDNIDREKLIEECN